MKNLLVLCFSAVSAMLFGQTITGKITGMDKNPIEFASVRLCNPEDTTVVKGAFTDQQGAFLLEDVETGVYLLKVSFLGHEIKYLPSISMNEKSLDLGTIELQLDKTQNLEEVTVSGSLDELKSGIDKKIYTVDQDISVRGGSANDVLGNIPSISVDQDGNISLRGDGNVTILINGRPSTLAAGDGQNLLDALPANSIEKIEVVTNPSAKYDPDGTSGIINIVLKKNRAKGFNGLVGLTGATGNLANVNLALSYQGKKTNTYLNYSLDYYEGYRNNFSDLYRSFGSDSSIYFDQNREGTDYKLGNTVVLGNEWNINKFNLFTVTVTGAMGDRVRTGNLENYFYTNTTNLYRHWDRTSRDPIKNLNADVNLGYVKSFKNDKGEWSFNANQSYGKRNTQGIYEEVYYNLDGTLSNQAPLNQRLDNTSQDQITTIQTDVSRVYEKLKARVEGGGKVIVQNEIQSTFSEARDTLTGVYKPDTLANFDYNYYERIYSVYGIFGQELGPFRYQVGLRGEYSEQTPELPLTGEVYKNEFLNLFPSGHIKYDLKKHHKFSLSYSRRINRASSGQLNPFSSYDDPFNLRRGNPALKPEFINSFDLGYSFSKKDLTMSASVFHRRTTEVINRVKVYYPDNSSVVTYGNIDESVSTGGELIFIYKPLKWWKNTVSFNGNYVDYTNNDPSVDWNNDGFSWGAKYITNIDFWKKSATLQVNAKYNGPMVRPQGIVQPRAGIDVALEKRLMNKRLSLGMRVTDVFNRQGFQLEFEQEGITQRAEYKWLTRRFYVSASYRFGGPDSKLKVPMNNGGGGDGGE